LAISYSGNGLAGQVSRSESSRAPGPPAPLKKRRRHEAWVKANRLARSWFTPDIVELEIELANAYWQDTQGNALTFLGVCRDGGCPYRSFSIPYLHRFSPGYRRKVKRELSFYLPFLLRYKYFLHITLTADPKNFVSQYDVKRAVERKWNSLRTRIRKRYPHVAIIATREWQKNGIGFHLHAVICGLSYIDKDWIMETWKDISESGWAVELRTIHGDARSVLNYVLKYVTKSAVNDNPNRIENISAVINWAVNGRAFSVSLPKMSLSKALSLLRSSAPRLGFIKSNSNRGSSSYWCRWYFLGYVPYHVHELGLTKDVNWVIEYFGLDRPPPWN